jgi:uncharacterized membrane protein
MILADFLLLIVPGAYLAAKHALYAFYFADGYLNLKQSFQRSAATGQGSWSFLLWFSVLILLLNFLGASLLGAGLIITIPLSLLMKTSIYCQLRAGSSDLEKGSA